jgi:biotin synthase
MAFSLLPRRAAACSLRTSSCASVRAFSTPVNDSFDPITASPSPPPEAGTGGNAMRNAVNATAPRYDWTRDEIREIYNTPLMELAFQSVRLSPVS